MTASWRLGAAGGLLALGLAGCTSSSSPAASTGASASATASSGSSVGSSASLDGGIPAIVRQVEPSVVTIITSKGLGSGVVMSSDGLVVTDAHVVEGASTVTVAFADGQRVSGTVKGSDTATDVALVQANRTGLPAARFQASLPAQGALTVVLGSPLGFENTVTAGIVSGLHRSIPGSASQGTPLVDLLQTDAPISPGNSGGAVVNAAGEVIGLSEAYIPPSAGAVALGFVTPAATVLDVVQQLRTTGHVQHAYAGLRPVTLTPQIAQQLGVTQQGAVVLDVSKGGPADDAGIRPGDVITGVGGNRITTVEELIGQLRQLQPGQSVPFALDRQGKELTVTVKLSDRPQA